MPKPKMTRAPKTLANELWQGSALEVCSALEGTPFDLVYLDPPYGVGAHMAMREVKGEQRGRRKKTSGRVAYKDGANIDALVAMLEPTLGAVRERMQPHASLYLHLDYRAAHDAKVAADRVFGRACFAGDIVWAPGNGSRGSRGFSVTHQTILLYVRDAAHKPRFSFDHPLLREPYADTSLRMHFKNVDEDGRNYRERTVNGKTYRYYADVGRRLGSIWTDIPAMVANTPLTEEATGYPTQKPEKLLERIIRAATSPGDTVADLMCGSGTTLAVAAKLERRFVGGDQGKPAIEVARARLDKIDASYNFRTIEP